MILDKIIERKKQELIEELGNITAEDLLSQIQSLPPTKDFYAALKGKAAISIIAEVKKASPSKGIICDNFNPAEIAREYERSGASAISVLTEKHFFLGSPEYLKAIRQEVKIPLLRKDFIIDPRQIYEARILGADAVLLIAAVLDIKTMSEFIKAADSVGLSCLVEVHTKDELKNALEAGARIVGINNRNLQSFKVDLNTTIELSRLIPKDVVLVSESGITGGEDIERLKIANIDAVLIGEAFMRSSSIADTLKCFTKI